MSDTCSVIVAIFFFVWLSVSLNSQNSCMTYNGELVNCLDSLGNKIGLWLEFDVDSIAFRAIYYSSLHEIENVNLITKDGNEIEEFCMNLDPLLVERLKEKVKSKFDWRRVVPREGQGLVVLYLLINPEEGIVDARVLRGIHYSFNKELMRALELIEDDLIFVCSGEGFYPIAVIFPIVF